MFLDTELSTMMDKIKNQRTDTEKRAARRIRSHIETRFHWVGTFFPGVVTNCSEDGMFICTGICIPVGAALEVLILHNNELLKIPVIVSRIARTENRCEGMGVKILNQRKDHLEFFSRHSFG